ncbi:MAG: hypothetical protein RL651_367 [Pseudomonadota bacterium]|jgi:hypothetical protein
MKNLFVWIVLVSTAALGVAVAQPNHENGYLVQGEIQRPYQSIA